MPERERRTRLDASAALRSVQARSETRAARGGTGEDRSASGQIGSRMSASKLSAYRTRTYIALYLVNY